MFKSFRKMVMNRMAAAAGLGRRKARRRRILGSFFRMEDRITPTVYLGSLAGPQFNGPTAIQDAINTAASGQTLLVDDNETYGDFIVPSTVGGLKDNLTIVNAFTGERPIVIASGNGQTALVSAVGTTIQGLEFRDGPLGFINFAAIRIAAGSPTIGRNTTIRDNVIGLHQVGIEVVAGLNAGDPAGAAGFGAIIEQNTIQGNREGLRFTGGLGVTTEVTVRNNFVINNAQGGAPAGSAGFRFAAGFIGSNNVFRHNTISGNGTNGGVLNESANAVNFSVNYWGTSDGPGTGLNGPGGGNVVSANVDTTPFIVIGTDTAPGTAGYQPNLIELTVHSLNSQTVVVGQPWTNMNNGRIAEGVFEVLPTGKVNVLNNGTTYIRYLEANVTIDKPVTVDGQSQAGVIVSPEVADVNLDSSFGGTPNNAFVLSNSDITLQDMTINGQSAAFPTGQNFRNGVIGDFNGQYSNLNVHHLTVTNIYRRGIQYSDHGLGNQIHDNTVSAVGPVPSGQSFGIITFGGGTTGNPILIQNNTVSNVTNGIGTQYVDPSAGTFPVMALITGNTVTLADVGMNLVGLTRGSLVGGTGGGAANTINVSGGTGTDIGVVVQFADYTLTGNITVQGNSITGTAGDSGMYLAANINAGFPIQILGNTITTTGQAFAANGDATGIFMPDDLSFVGSGGAGSSYATISGNTISGFFRGIDMAKTFTTDPAAVVNATIGGASAANNNEITGPGSSVIGSSGVRVQDANDVTDGRDAVATISNNSASIQSAAIGVDVNGGDANLSANLLTGNDTGIRVTNGGQLTLGAGNTITGGSTGLRMDGPTVALVGLTLSNTAFNMQSGDYVRFANFALDNTVTNGTAAVYDGVVGASATFFQAFAIESKLFHEVDDNTLGRINFVPGNIFVVPVPSPTPTTNDYLVIKNAVEAAAASVTPVVVNLNNNGTFFNWVEPNAALSWSLGNDGISNGGPFTTGFDDYTITLPLGEDDVTVTAPLGLGSATIDGPGDIASEVGEGVFFGFDNHNWTFSNIEFTDFDIGILYFGGSDVDAGDGTTINNNFFRVPVDSAAGTDPLQNIAIHYAFGNGQTISNNTIDMVAGVVGSASVGIQTSDTFGSTSQVMDGLLINNNTMNVTGAGAAGRIRGLWENSDTHGSDIIVSNNDFVGFAPTAGTDLIAYQLTSHSAAAGTVEWNDNTVTGANIGFQWVDDGISYSAHLPIDFEGNTGTNVITGMFMQNGGKANISESSFTNAAVPAGSVGVNVTDGSVANFVTGATRNVIQGFATGVRFSGEELVTLVDSSGTVAQLDFEGAVDNGTDVRIDSTAGTIAFGNSIDFGGDTFYIDLIHTQSIDLTPLTGITFDVGQPLPHPANLQNNFRIEDRMHHRIDTDLPLTNGLIQWFLNGVERAVFITSAGTDHTIQRGIDAPPGVTNWFVYVEAGTYNESVNLNRSLTVRGAQWGVSAAGATPRTGPESIVNGNSPGFTVSAANAVLDGFTVTGTTDTAGIITTTAAGGYQILNNIVTANVFGMYLNDAVAGGQTVVAGNLFDGNNLAGSASGIGIYTDQGLSNAVIRANRFKNHNTGGVNMGGPLVGGGGPVTGITVGGATAADGNAFETGDGVYFIDVDMATVRFNTFTGAVNTDVLRNAVEVPGGSNTLTIADNTFTDRVRRAITVYDAGFPAPNSDVSILRNTVTQNLSLIPNSLSMIELFDTTGSATVSDNDVILSGTAPGGVIVNAIEVGSGVIPDQTITLNTASGANGAGLLLSSGAGTGIANVGAVSMGNSFTANRTGIDVQDGRRARIHNNTITGNGAGVNVIGAAARAVLQNNNLNNNTSVGIAGAGLVVQGNALVDAGGGGALTGLGGSTGGNTFLGYSPGKSYAIIDINSDTVSHAFDVFARFNDFDGTTYAAIEAVVFHHIDLPFFSYVIYTGAVGTTNPAVENYFYLPTTTALQGVLPNQRSLIRVIDVVIDAPVFGNYAAAIGLTRTGATSYSWYGGALRTGDVIAGSAPTITGSVDGATGKTTIRLVFANTGPVVFDTPPGTGSFTEFGSLIDGDYTMNVNGAGLEMLFAGSGTTTTSDTESFYRFFGDMPGAVARFIDISDRRAFNDASGNPSSVYLTYFDFDGDGIFFEPSDQAQFNIRFGNSI